MTDTKPTAKSIAIVGGGITGLTAAYELRQRGVPVALYEASDRVGGVIQTIRKDGFLAECGPNSILNTSPQIGELIDRLGIRDKVANSLPSAQKRYVVRDGKPVALPASPVSFLKTKLFSMKAKIRLLKEPFTGRGASDTETLADFVRRRLGQEFLDYAVGPFVSGVFAGDPEMLGVAFAFPKLFELEQEYGSLIKGAMLGARKRKKRGTVSKKDARMISFADGMDVLTDTLGDALGDAVRRNMAVARITHDDSGWTLHDAAGTALGTHSAVLLAIPAHGITSMDLGDVDVSFLNDVYYPPVASLTMGFDLDQFDTEPDGFGMLIPRKEGFNSLGTLFTSSIFANRAPDGKVTMTTYIGGSLTPDRAKQSEDELRNGVLEDLGRLLGLKGDPCFCHLSVHKQAIPQYTPAYKGYLKQMAQLEDTFPGLHLAGHYRNGISVSDSILAGLSVGEKMATAANTETPEN